MIEKPVEICSQPGWFHYHGRIVTLDDSYVNVYASTYVLIAIVVRADAALAKLTLCGAKIWPVSSELDS
jgi:hypothetical protein